VSGRLTDRLTMPLVREDGVLRSGLVARGDRRRGGGSQGGGRSRRCPHRRPADRRGAYAYQRFARSVLGTNNVDFRARAASARRSSSSPRRGRSDDRDVGHVRGLERAGKVVLVGFEPEEESPIVFLRLRKAVRKKKLAVVAVARC